MFTYAGRPDVIIHCAGSGSVGFSMDHPFQDFQRTVSTTAAVLEFVRLQSPDSALVYPSSAGVYGIAEKLPINESALLQPISPYGLHKKMAENLCLSYGKHYKIAASVIRLFSIYGNTLRKQLLWDACRKLIHNENSFFGSGQERRDWLHIEDTATLLFAAGQNASPDCPIVNGGSGTGISTREILTELFTYFGSSELPQFTSSNRPGDPVDYIADISRVGQWNWRPLKKWKEGIREYVDWYKSELQ
jgi:UDP-glucose 4-epimerase